MFPENARMVFCIGAQKAGTTWLYDALRKSPQVHFSRNKELHYFDVASGRAQQVLDLRVRAAQNLSKRLVAETGPRNRANVKLLQDLTSLLSIYTGDAGDHGPYLAYLLESYQNQKVICDITPAYAILDRATFGEMGRIGSAKFMFILRDPIDRMWSQIRMAVKMANTLPENFQEVCETRARQLIDSNRLAKIERADYQRTITELEAAIPADQIQYLFYETLFQTDTMANICRFLDIPPITIAPETLSNLGITAVLPDDLRRAFHEAFAPQYDFIGDRFGANVPARWAGPITTDISVT